MESSLQTLFGAIAQAQDEAELKQSIIVKVGEYFHANRWGLKFLDQLPTINDDTPLMMKLALSLDYNPILRYLVKRHAAVHDEMILPPGVWQTICPRPDHGHVMVGPIVSNSQLVGGIGITRHRDDRAFNTEDLTDLCAICLHLSTRLTVMHSPSNTSSCLKCDRLTPRETEIAQLVAQGLTSAEIGTALWITENTVKQALKRMFRKLKVSSRAEMIAQLFMNSKLLTTEDEVS
ncbi:MAG: LuxR family transcriptional regulator [Goleter apudmare HA4340-LM2]|jgi:DNA-binding CsgD family transcriptional regulator|nr:LuxR family transcriptional regulator [Goleter apudmare HA4340-LM2]